MWHSYSFFFFLAEALKLLPWCLLWQINHMVYDAVGDTMLFPHFWECSPVSAPCLSSSFKSIYCSQKSIRLSEGRCRFSGYGWALLCFLPNTPTYKHLWCLRWLNAFLGGEVTVRKKFHASLKRKGIRAFSLDIQIDAFTSSYSQKSIFMLDQITSLIIATQAKCSHSLALSFFLGFLIFRFSFKQSPFTR